MGGGLFLLSFSTAYERLWSAIPVLISPDLITFSFFLDVIIRSNSVLDLSVILVGSFIILSILNLRN